jgi:hypothetical protein
MRKLRASLLAGSSGVIALAATTVLASPAFAGVVGSYQFGQNGQYPLGTMTFAKPNLYSDTFTQGPTDSGVWHQKGQAIKVKITTSSQPLDVGCVLKGTLTSTGIGSASAPGSIRCPDGTKGTWYAVKSAGTSSSSMATGASGIHSWFQG